MKNKVIAEAVDMLGNFSFPKIPLRVMKILKEMWEPTDSMEKERSKLSEEATSGL